MKENIITSRKASTVDLEKIRTVKGRDRIASSYSSYLTDESKIDLGKADVLFFPETADEVAAIFKEMSKKREKITISGARTGIVGGCVPLGGSVISLERMNAISCVRHEENDKWFIKCQAGVTLKELAEKINIKEFILDNECDEAGKRF
ncbi:MAG: FAD-binding oxidoreductase, partial [Candidatus Odinarchaeota archaeon]